ncbi:MAG: membrane protein insertion efficiency factor YidD [Nitrospirae bacterium]|nr:membrane protein insertion efficiency factor YidD [Nitrospirota bacterium]
MKLLLIFTIKIYQKFISPFLGNSCRFHPSCSSYCIEAVGTQGIFNGLWLFVKRIVKCHPFYSGGYDPLPIDPRHIK